MSANAPASDLFRTEHMRRRRIVNKVVEGAATVAALLAVALLVIVVSSVVRRGWEAINIDFFTKTPAIYTGFGPRPASGISSAIIGTLIIIGLALLMALPVAVLTAIYLNELAPRKLAGVLTLAFDVLNGIPAIVLGIFVFVFVVVGHGQAAWKASFALAILMVPMIARSTQEVLALVPASMREASLALGAAKWRTTLSIVLPQAVGGIVTGATLATARAAGETAPLLFTSALYSNSVSLRPPGADRVDPHVHLHLSRAGRPGSPPASVGRCRGPDRNHPHRKPDRALVRGQERPASERRAMTDVNYPSETSVQNPPESAGLPSAIDPSLLAARPPSQTLARDRVFGIENLTAFYGNSPALRDVSFEIYQRMVTAIIGPSGCGKSTFIRCLNRMNDVIPGFKTEGRILYHDVDLQGRNIDPVSVRRRIGMVFQRPNPFPKSIYENVAYGPRILGLKKGLDERVEKALKRAALWDEVKDRLKRSAWSLSGGQQQRLCIARCLAIEPEVILMDEPASALDPIATTRIEDLMHELKRDYTIVVVTHNMQQAARVADMTAFFSISKGGEGERSGVLVEYDDTKTIFTQPKESRTEDYVTGRFG